MPKFPPYKNPACKWSQQGALLLFLRSVWFSPEDSDIWIVEPKMIKLDVNDAPAPNLKRERFMIV